jgi:hypothetical protein
LKINAAFVFVCLFIFCFNSAVKAQSARNLKGLVRDTTNLGLPGANVRLIAGKDTLTTTTDSAGVFKFANIRLNKISVVVKSLGFVAVSKVFVLDGKAVQVLPDLILKTELRQLDEVVVKARLNPVKLMKDTVEYNAAAFTVKLNDLLGDLLKQLPGVEVDKEGNVVTEGKTLTKLRVNGKDFFTSNVKDFLAQLPADAIAKLQVIDDYGDKANFTGIKKGEPQKMLNLVLKPNRGSGKFGIANASAGTNDRYALSMNGHVFEGDRQVRINANASNTSNGAGINTAATLGGSYRNKIGKNLTLSGNYNYGYNSLENLRESYTETINSIGTTYTQANTKSLNKGNNHNFDLSLQSEKKENFLNIGLRGSLNNNLSNSLYDARQTGVSRQNLNTLSTAHHNTPNLNTEINFSHKLKKEGRIISGGITGGRTTAKNEENQNNQIGYFDQESELLVKDSVRIQLVDTYNRNLNLTANFTYTEPLHKGKDTLVSRSLDFSYDFGINHTSNILETSIRNDLGIFKRLDTLSNQYNSSFIKQALGINYRYDSEKLNYSIGISAQPNLLTGAYEGRSDKIRRMGFNMAPVTRLSYIISRRNTLNFYYNGNGSTPNFNQLQPVPDTRNLQNIIIGNPDLKAAFNHSLNLNYRHTSAANGSSIQFGLRGSVVQDQVVANTILIRDTLNSFRQETRYLNTNGNYTVGGNYMFAFPLGAKKMNLELKGSMGYDHRIAFSDLAENISEGININQGLGFRMNQKWLMLNTHANYNYKSNVYSLASSRSNKVQTWLFDLDARVFILKSLNCGATTSKTINQGYSFAQANPLLLGGFVEKTFFKDQKASMRLQGNDLLNQGNNLSRTVTDNSIRESKNNQVTRYFLLTCIWRLNKFGK